MPDVFFYELFEEESEAMSRYLPAGITADSTWKTIQERDNRDPPASFISIRTQSLIPGSWAQKMTGILTRSTGYDHIVSFRQKSENNISCGYLPRYCRRAVAEQAILLWMSLLRKLPGQVRQFSQFHRDGLTGRECEHKTLLVVGVGNIGSEIVAIGKSLNMKVLGVDLVRNNPSVEYISIEEGTEQADIIVCAMNLTADNRGYFHYELLRRAKAGVLFINIARGELSPACDLLRLLNENHLGGVGLDVYNDESELAVSLRAGEPADSEEVRAVLEIAQRDNVILTPHNAFNTAEAVEKKARETVKQITHFLEKGNFIWPVP